jgi:hypothetical protein
VHNVVDAVCVKEKKKKKKWRSSDRVSGARERNDVGTRRRGPKRFIIISLL